MIASIPPDEAQRISYLHQCHILDTLPEEDYNNLVFLAAEICDAPIALISLIDAERQWFKARFGLETEQTPRSDAFCTHAILHPDQLMIVPDATRDERFVDNPLVSGDPNIRFYAGAPIVVSMARNQDQPSPDPVALGTVCVIDSRPRMLTPTQEKALQALAHQVGNLLDLRLGRILQNETVRQLQETEQHLQKANIALEQFATVASHDLKEPLRKMRMFAGMIVTDAEKGNTLLSDTSRSHLERILRSGARMTSLIEGLLTLSRASQRRKQARRGPVDLSKVAQEAVEDLWVRLKETAGQVEIGELPTVWADPLQMRQLLQNLIGNSLKYCREGVPPLVEIKAVLSEQASDTDDCVCFMVRDNGRGIAPADTERVFLPFERLDSRDTDGSGVGLTICRQIVEAQGGTIRVEAGTEVGATFLVCLRKATPNP